MAFRFYVDQRLEYRSWFCVCGLCVCLCVCSIRVAESTEEVTKLRPVRLIREDGIIRPYNHSEAQGLDLFQVRSPCAPSARPPSTAFNWRHGRRPVAYSFSLVFHLEFKIGYCYECISNRWTRVWKHLGLKWREIKNNKTTTTRKLKIGKRESKFPNKSWNVRYFLSLLALSFFVLLSCVSWSNPVLCSFSLCFSRSLRRNRHS